jgi:hypothetical protein
LQTVPQAFGLLFQKVQSRCTIVNLDCTFPMIGKLFASFSNAWNLCVLCALLRLNIFHPPSPTSIAKAMKVKRLPPSPRLRRDMMAGQDVRKNIESRNTASFQ